MKDYYETLGIARNASAEEVKKAYRKLAHQYHPDKHGGDEKRFKEINEAYQALNDPKKRETYDRFGTTNSQGFGGFSDGFGFAQNGAWEGDLGNIFEDLFENFGGLGGFSARGGQTSWGRQRARGSDIAIALDVSFAESVFGSTRSVSLEHNISCLHCHGSGGEPGSGNTTCSTCRGTGSIRENRKSIFGTITAMISCNKCQGKGKVPEKICHECRGAGIVRSAETIAIEIPPGIRDGEGIKIPQKGEAAIQGVAGDLYVKIHVLPHPIFRREGQDLTMDLTMPLSTMLKGGEVALDTLDGKIEIKIPELSNAGDILRIRGKGVAKSRGGRGDLLIRLSPKLPKRLSSHARTLLNDLEKEGL